MRLMNSSMKCGLANSLLGLTWKSWSSSFFNLTLTSHCSCKINQPQISCEELPQSTPTIDGCNKASTVKANKESQRTRFSVQRHLAAHTTNSPPFLSHWGIKMALQPTTPIEWQSQGSSLAHNSEPRGLDMRCIICANSIKPAFIRQLLGFYSTKLYRSYFSNTTWN